MNWRWNITALIVALAFIGISLDQSHIDANQEIVVKFNTDSISVNQAKRAVSDITNQLKAIGVEDVQVSEISDGRLKVTYYSTVDVAVIKNLFNKQNRLHLGDSHSSERDYPFKVPFSNDSSTYIVDVIQIQSDFNFDVSLQGLIVESKVANDQYLKPKISSNTTEVDFELKYSVESELSSGYCSITLVEDDATYKMPEVRAGPYSYSFQSIITA